MESYPNNSAAVQELRERAIVVGLITRETPSWRAEDYLDELELLADTAGANYVARATPYHVYEMKTNLKEALSKKGFSVVEVYSPCPTLFGKNNRMKETRDMLHWLKEKGLSVEAYRRMSPEAAREGYFAVGKLVERDEPDFNTRYEQIRAAAMARKG